MANLLSSNFRERERIKRKKARWRARLLKMPMLERMALLGTIADLGGSGEVVPQPKITAATAPNRLKPPTR